MWVVDHEDDIASDLSVFHRIDDPSTMSAVRYFALAPLLAAYAGVMQARVHKAREDEREAGRSPHSAPRATSTPERPSRVSDDVALSMLAAEGWVEHPKEES